MRRIITLSALLLCGVIQAQESRSIPTEAMASFAVKLGTTAPVRELQLRQDRSIDKKKFYKSRIIPPRNFIGRYDSRVINQRAQSLKADPLRQRNILKSRGIPVEPLVNKDGLASGASPHDPTGDVGRNVYMQAINATQIGIFNKENGSLISQFNASSLWNTLGFNSGGDPIVMYDQEVERWIITEFPSGFGAESNQLLFAISLDEDPMGSYDVYNFTTPNFPDYPKYAIWSNAYSVTTNEQGPSVLHAYFLNREEILAGKEIVSMQRVSFPGNNQTEAGFFVASPVDWTGRQAPPQDRGPILLALNDASWNLDESRDKLEIFSLEIDWENENNTSWNQQSLEVSDYDSYPCADAGFFFSCIPQMGSTGLDGIPETIMNQSHYRNFGTHESIVLNFITDVTAGENLSGIRWMELRRNSASDWSVYQEGTYAPDDGLHRFMGGIAMDGSGNIALAFNVSGENSFAGIRFTGRRSGDPLGQMTVDEYNAVEGASAINSGSRFGDYAHMTVDPYNDRVFWYTSEYAGSAGSSTRIISYELSRDSIDIGPVSFKSPVSGARLGASETVEIGVRNFGILPVDSFSISYQLDGGIVFTEQVDSVLLADEVYSHSFMQTADLSELGNYEFRFFTSLASDGAVFNDTVDIVVQHIPELDLGIEPGNNIPQQVCGMATTASVRIENLGFDTIQNVELQVVLNGDTLRTIKYSGELLNSDNTMVDLPLDNLQDGINSILVQILNVNDTLDQITDNNLTSFEVLSIADGFLATLSILFDDYPDETSWSLALEDGTPIAEGGPYDEGLEQMIIEENLCLDPDACYRFTFFDSYGDGISFAGVTGDYQISTDEGTILANLMNPEFGAEEVNEFCAEFECSIEVDASTVPESAEGLSDGLIMIEVLDGVGPFAFSIDGGQTVQESGTFSGLTAGRYTIIVEGANDCSIELELEVTSCQLDFAVEIIPESEIGSMDGELTILVEGAIGNTRYSIDGGQSFSDMPSFTNLSTGDYNIIVEDSIACSSSKTVKLGNLVDIKAFSNDNYIKVYPNPTDGVFRIEVGMPEYSSPQLELILLDQNGRKIQRTVLSRYSDKYLGIMSLHHYQPGAYFLSLNTENYRRVIRVIRQ